MHKYYWNIYISWGHQTPRFGQIQEWGQMLLAIIHFLTISEWLLMFYFRLEMVKMYSNEQNIPAEIGLFTSYILSTSALKQHTWVHNRMKIDSCCHNS